MHRVKSSNSLQTRPKIEDVCVVVRVMYVQCGVCVCDMQVKLISR